MHSPRWRRRSPEHDFDRPIVPDLRIGRRATEVPGGDSRSPSHRQAARVDAELLGTVQHPVHRGGHVVVVHRVRHLGRQSVVDRHKRPAHRGEQVDRALELVTAVACPQPAAVHPDHDGRRPATVGHPGDDHLEGREILDAPRVAQVARRASPADARPGAVAGRSGRGHIGRGREGHLRNGRVRCSREPPERRGRGSAGVAPGQHPPLV